MVTPFTLSEVDWLAIADEVLRRLERPAVLVDADARVRAANSLFSALVERSLEELRGLTWEQLFGSSPSSREGAHPLEAAGRREAPLRTGGKDAIDAVLDVSRLGPKTASWTLVQVVCTRRRPDGIRGGAAALGYTYEVRLSEGLRGTIVEVRGDAGSLGVGPGELCYRALHRRQAPCEGCSVFHGPRSGRHILPVDCEEGGFRLVEVDADAEGETATVTTSFIASALLSELVQARVESLARRGDLSERERELLSLLFLGRGPKDLAMLLQVSERTAKYQQAMVLRKVGAASRADLVRLLIEPWPARPSTVPGSSRPAT